MSETAIHQPQQEKVKEPQRSLAIEANSTDTSTNAASDMKSDLALSPGESQCTNSTEDCEEYTAEDIKQLEVTSQKLNNEIVEHHNYKKEFHDIKEMMQKAFSSGLPVSVKMRMMESAMERLKTKINCVNENNRNIKSKMGEADKNSPGSVDGEQDKKQEKANEECAKNSTIDECKDKSKLKRDSEIKHEEAEKAAKIAEVRKATDELRDESEKLEEAIAQMKQQRNILLVTIEDLRDDFDDIQYLIKEKKNALDKKVQYTEDLRKKIANESLHKPSVRSSGGATHRKTISDAGGFTVRNHIPSAIGEKITDISTAVLNTSVFQDVSSKLTQVFGSMGRAFGLTREEAHGGQILSDDFMRELNNNNVNVPTTARGNNNNKANNIKSPRDGKPSGTSPTKTHTRTMSSNLSPQKGRK